MNENLNIEHHRKGLVIKALNKFGNLAGAAKALGVSISTLYRYKKHFNISKIDDQYVEVETVK